MIGLLKRIRRRIYENRHGPWSIEVSEQEAALLKRGNLEGAIQWSDVDTITAHKQDRFTWDPIVVVLWAGDSGVPFEELTSGFNDFLDKLHDLWPQIDRDWISKVNERAFAPNQMVLWKRRTDKGDD